MLQPKAELDHKTIQVKEKNHLRKMILTNQLKENDRIKQDDLAKQLGVSRTHAREAKRQLESEGLITILPYKGAVILEELEDIYQIRLALKTHATCLAFKHMTAVDVQQLEKIVHDMRLAYLENNPEETLEVNRKFYLERFGLTQPEVTVVIYEELMLLFQKADEDQALKFAADHLRESLDELKSTVLYSLAS